MYRNGRTPMVHPSTPANIATINYTLSWPHLENPSNTTFVGSTQIDICRCPRSDLPQENSEEPGHIYTRYKCVGPEVTFTPPEKELWVLQAPHGPLNMLRPATEEERERCRQIHDDTDPTTYSKFNLLFLSGPCPRGRYQAYATLHFLKSLQPAAQQRVSELSLLLQPYEEDCSEHITAQMYGELAEFIIQKLPGFKKLHLSFWDDEMKLRSAASQFSILLHKAGVKIVVGCSWGKCKVKEYDNVRHFLEDMEVGGRRPKHALVNRDLLWEQAQENSDSECDDVEESDEEEHNEDEEQDGDFDGTEEVLATERMSNEVSLPRSHMALQPRPDATKIPTQGHEPRTACDWEDPQDPVPFTQEDSDSDGEWTDIVLSPTPPDGSAEDSWQKL